MMMMMMMMMIWWWCYPSFADIRTTYFSLPPWSGHLSSPGFLSKPSAPNWNCWDTQLHGLSNYWWFQPLYQRLLNYQTQSVYPNLINPLCCLYLFCKFHYPRESWLRQRPFQVLRGKTDTVLHALQAIHPHEDRLSHSTPPHLEPAADAQAWHNPRPQRADLTKRRMLCSHN